MFLASPILIMIQLRMPLYIWWWVASTLPYRLTENMAMELAMEHRSSSNPKRNFIPGRIWTTHLLADNPTLYHYRSWCIQEVPKQKCIIST